MNKINFEDISYLKIGNSRQRIAYSILKNNFIFEKLQKYTPVLAGTIPINIDILNSDFDILCCWKNKNEFISDIIKNFETEQNFNLFETEISGEKTIVSSFYIDDTEIEIFGQSIPVKQQQGYRHMIIEHNILKEKGEDFRIEIIKLKQKGYKTEPAFAKLLNLEGDAYKELLKLEK